MDKDVNLLVFVSGVGDEAQAGFQGTGEATPEGRKASGAWCDQIGSGAAAGRIPADGGGVGTAPCGRREGCSQTGRSGTATPAGCRTGKGTGQGAYGGRAGRGVSDRALDVATYRQVDYATFWRRIQCRPLVASSPQNGFLVPEAGEARDTAERGRNCPLEAARLAGAKKKAKREGRTIVFIDESGLSERPSVARTWSLRGHTPVLQHSFTWKQLSAIAGLSFWNFYFRFFPGAIRSEQIIEFLGALKRQIRQPLLIIWDGVATHRSRKVKVWLEELNGHIAVARLPPYAPELNPVEAIWAYLKKHEIANLCLNTIGEVGQFARNRLKSMQRRPALVASFRKQAELAF